MVILPVIINYKAVQKRKKNWQEIFRLCCFLYNFPHTSSTTIPFYACIKKKFMEKNWELSWELGETFRFWNACCLQNIVNEVMKWGTLRINDNNTKEFQTMWTVNNRKTHGCHKGNIIKSTSLYWIWTKTIIAWLSEISPLPHFFLLYFENTLSGTCDNKTIFLLRMIQSMSR